MAMLRSRPALLLVALAASSCDDTTAPADGGLDAGGAAGDAAAAAPDAAPEAPAREPGSIVPSTHDFGPMQPGAESDPFTFRVSNTGSEPVPGLAVSVTGQDFILAVNQCAASASLAAGATCAMDVRFRPLSRGLKTGSLIVVGGGETITASLTGTGFVGVHVAINPTFQMFDGRIGGQSAPVTFTIGNSGDGDTGPVTVSLGGADASSFKILGNGCLAPLLGPATCGVSVVLEAATAGVKTATLTASSTPGGMAVASLSGLVN